MPLKLKSELIIRDAYKIDYVKAIMGQICLCIITVALIGYNGQYFFLIIIVTEAIAVISGASIMKYLILGRNGNDKNL